MSAYLQLHGCFPSVSCSCSQLLSLRSLHVFFSGLSQAGSARLSFDSCGIVNSPAALPTSSLLLTFLSTSFAIASFNNSLPRSKRSDPSGVVLTHSLILTRQGSEWACARFPDLIAFQPGHPAVVSEGFDVCPGDSLCTPSNGTGGGGNGSICVTGLSTSTCHQQLSTGLRSRC